ncbi:MAG: hypothetical protein MI861_15410, partial [Pirellulales bacterium]|nr:hypothetical protein [Pirellulales bacterium]
MPPPARFDLPAWPPRWPEIQQALEDAVGSGQWGQYSSELNESLKRRIARRFGGGDVRLCCSGSAAIEIAL